MSSKMLLIAATALAVIPAAASARDGVPYVGVEGGLIKPEKLKLDYRRNATVSNDAVVLKSKTGFDIDLIGGYDFGLIRAEGELGYKRANFSDVFVTPAALVTVGRPFVSGRSQVQSAMLNALVDLGADDGLQFYAGGGAGAARVSVRSSISGAGVPVGAGIYGRDSNFAWQLIGGMRLPVSDNVDLGLKYRYFRTKFAINDPNNGLLAESLRGKYKSHSLLASLIFNFGAPAPAPAPVVEVAPPPPPPPPPPASQTCPDGSVILATESCPVPPPPPPPPEPAPVRG